MVTPQQITHAYYQSNNKQKYRVKYRLWLRHLGWKTKSTNTEWNEGQGSIAAEHFIVDSYEQHSEGSLVAAEGNFSNDDGDVEDNAL